MHNQPKFYPQRGTDFYADGRSVRPQVDNTVARGQLHQDSYFYSGMQAGAGSAANAGSAPEGDSMPFPVTIDVLARGQERYNIFCTPCHSRVGNGAGMIVDRGYAKAGNFHTARLQAAPLGHFYNVISNGYGAMPDYAAQITPEDRWAIVAYIKALQLSQNAQPADVAAGQHVEPLTDISVREGFSSAFAAEWALPPTAVSGTPNGENYVIPPDAMGSAGGGSAQFPAHPTLSRQQTVPAVGNIGPAVAPHGQSSTGYPVPAGSAGPK